MRSPALALTGTVWRRYRWGLAACAAVWLVLAALGQLLPRGAWAPAAADDPIPPLLIVVIGSFAPVLIFVFYAFSWITVEAQLEARESGFPARTFTLPVSTAALVVWPMLQGTAAVAFTWIAWVGAVLWPAGLDAPLVWPALLMAALLAWLQALVWRPFPLRFLRIVAAALVLTAIGMGPMFAQEFGTPPAVVAGVLAALLPAAYGVAVRGVARARRGDVRTWTWPSQLVGALVSRPPRRGAGFLSPLQAQTWFEWRRRGMGFPLMVGLISAAWLLLVLTGAGERVIEILAAAGEARGVAAAAAALTAPGVMLAVFLPIIPFLAGVAGTELGGVGVVDQKPPGGAAGCHPFLALRPLTDGELVLAKLRMAVRATLAGWSVVLLAAFVCLGLTGKWRVLAGAPLIQAHTAWEVCGGLAAGLAGLVLLTWLLLVANLWIGLMGRRWLNYAISTVVALVWIPLGLLAHWLAGRPDLLSALATALPYIAAAVVALKMLLAVWLARALWRRGLVGPRTLATAAVAWAVAAVAALAFLGWLASDRAPFAALVLVVMAALPLNRFAAAPLALAWNRHR